MERSTDTPVTYSLTQPLPPQPDIEEAQGRDLLLAGLLSEEEFLWRNCIITLICVAIFADRAPEAFFFMKQWAEIVLQDKSAQSEQIQDIYANFMTEVSEKVYAWQNDLATMRLSAKPAYKTFTYQTELMAKQGQRAVC